MSEFKVGDRVEAISRGYWFKPDGIMNGCEYLIKGTTKNGAYLDFVGAYNFLHKKEHFKLVTNKTIKKENKMNEKTAGEVQEKTVYNDERFTQILEKSCELNGLLREIDGTTEHKLDELLGSIPQKEESPSDKNVADGWASRIIDNQNISISLCKEIQEKIDRF